MAKQPNKVTVAVCMPPHFRDWLRQQAGRSGVSVSAYLNMQLARLMRESDAPAKQ